MQYLDNSPLLDVQEVALQLNVRHKSGHCHSYVVRYELSNESECSQLTTDLPILLKMLSERCHYGVYLINNRKYYAIEQSKIDDPTLKALHNGMPEVELDSFPVNIDEPNVLFIQPDPTLTFTDPDKESTNKIYLEPTDQISVVQTESISENTKHKTKKGRKSKSDQSLTEDRL